MHDALWRQSLVLVVLFTGMAAAGARSATDDPPNSDEGGVCFQSTFQSTADASHQPIVIQLPPGYSPDGAYPLLVHLSFGLPDPDSLPTYDKPYVKLHATGHKLLGFLGLVEQDVLAILAKMQQDYAIDERRVFLSGFSAGASSAMTIVSRHPDRFAGAIPLGAFGNNALLENLQNVPVFCHHGRQDWVSAIDNVRVYFQQLRATQAPALLREYPDMGHSVGTPASIDAWLMAQRRPDRPRRILYRCDTPEHGRAYWLHVRRFGDVHREARVAARFHASRDRQEVILQADNVDVLELILDRSPARRERGLLVQANRDQLHVRPPLPERVFLVRGETHWTLTTAWEPPATNRRPYRPGAAANLYNGEPLLVVYGTQGEDPVRSAHLRRLAEELAECGGPYYTSMDRGFPTKPDRALTEQEMAEYNLLLVGGPEDNEAVRRIADDLPFSIGPDRELEIEHGRSIPLSSAVLGCAFFNPLQPRRFVYLFAPYLSNDEFAKLRGNSARWLPGADGTKKGDQPDVVVQTVDQVQRCQLQFDAQWRWRELPGRSQRFPEDLRSRTASARHVLTILRRRSAADFALWWGPKSRLFVNHDFNTLQSYDSRFFTQADYRTKSQPMTSMTGSVTGAELVEIYERWIQTEEIQTVPRVDPTMLEPDRRYRLVLPHELVVKLGRRQRLLLDVAEGPAVSPEEFLREIFP